LACASVSLRLIITVSRTSLQSDDLFYVIMNEIHPRFNNFETHVLNKLHAP